jgi:hypothetical protein
METARTTGNLPWQLLQKSPDSGGLEAESRRTAFRDPQMVIENLANSRLFDDHPQAIMLLAHAAQYEK